MKKPLTKPLKILLALMALSITFASYSQADILGLNINKANELSLQTNLMLGVPVDKEKAFFRLNLEESKISKFQDDTGKDLIMPGKGYLPDQTYESYNDYNSRAEVHLAFKGTPEPGAKSVTVQGTLILEYQEEGEEELSSHLKMPGNNASMVNATDDRSYEVFIAAEASTDTDNYIIYGILTDVPVKSVEVVGGDDSEEAKSIGLAVGDNQFVFKKEPEEIDVKMTLGKIQKVEIPLDMTFGIGF